MNAPGVKKSVKVSDWDLAKRLAMHLYKGRAERMDSALRALRYYLLPEAASEDLAKELKR